MSVIGERRLREDYISIGSFLVNYRKYNIHENKIIYSRRIYNRTF